MGGENTEAAAKLLAKAGKRGRERLAARAQNPALGRHGIDRVLMSKRPIC